MILIGHWLLLGLHKDTPSDNKACRDLVYSRPPPPASCRTSLWPAACLPGPGAGGCSCGPPQPANRASAAQTYSPWTPLLGSAPHKSAQGSGACYLVSHLFDFAFIFVGPLQSFSSPLLLSIQLAFQLPHLCGVRECTEVRSRLLAFSHRLMCQSS